MKGFVNSISPYIDVEKLCSLFLLNFAHELAMSFLICFIAISHNHSVCF